jgi:hypothetical protein
MVDDGIDKSLQPSTAPLDKPFISSYVDARN